MAEPESESTDKRHSDTDSYVSWESAAAFPMFAINFHCKRLRTASGYNENAELARKFKRLNANSKNTRRGFWL